MRRPGALHVQRPLAGVQRRCLALAAAQVKSTASAVFAPQHPLALALAPSTGLLMLNAGAIASTLYRAQVKPHMYIS